MVRKLIILGIDGMDWDVIVRYKDKLPNLYGLMQKNNYPHLRSVFPADTTPAWSTIYTGLDPSEHASLTLLMWEQKRIHISHWCLMTVPLKAKLSGMYSTNRDFRVQ